jgi:hypothetical protein
LAGVVDGAADDAEIRLSPSPADVGACPRQEVGELGCPIVPDIPGSLEGVYGDLAPAKPRTRAMHEVREAGIPRAAAGEYESPSQ